MMHKIIVAKQLRWIFETVIYKRYLFAYAVLLDFISAADAQVIEVPEVKKRNRRHEIIEMPTMIAV